MADAVNIFISHKVIDEQAAVEIKCALERLGDPERLKVFVSEHIEGGTDWFRRIQERLVDSNLLLLLYTDSTQDWDWCMYEAGLFTDLKGGDFRRIACIHATGEPPEPLKHLQGIKAEPDNILTLLNDLFLKKSFLKLDCPLSPELATQKSKIQEEATYISKLLKRKKVESHYYGLHLFIHVENPDDITPERVPPDSVVTSDQPLTWDLFDKQPGRWRWAALENEARANKDQMWLQELAEAIYRAKKMKKIYPIRSTFLCRADMKNYRPILYRSDRLANNTIVFKVLFYQESSWQFVNVPDQTATLVTALIVSTRLRHEVLKPYLRRLRSSAGAEEIEEACTQIQQKIAVIEEEGAARGLMQQEKLIACFDTPEEQGRLLEMYQKWYQCQQGLAQCFETRQYEAVERHLSDIQSLNDHFLHFGTLRLHDLNQMQQGGLGAESTS